VPWKIVAGKFNLLYLCSGALFHHLFSLLYCLFLDFYGLSHKYGDRCLLGEHDQSFKPFFTGFEMSAAFSFFVVVVAFYPELSLFLKFLGSFGSVGSVV
jgi:hypothetical protein